MTLTTTIPAAKKTTFAHRPNESRSASRPTASTPPTEVAAATPSRRVGSSLDRRFTTAGPG
jgi:hypothetical protein